MIKRRLKFNRVHFQNRWTIRYPPDRWTIIGVHRTYSYSDVTCFQVCFFGFECHLWFNIVLTKKSLKWIKEQANNH